MAAGTTVDAANLSELISPSSEEAFFAHIFGKQFAHFRGETGRLSGLLPWPELNRILRQHRLEPPRLRLVREGKVLPRSKQPIERQLREGATLVLDKADELHEPLTRLAENLELLFHVRIQVNAYAGWRSSRGFDLHWDDHDVLILQVAGRKHWKIYGVTRQSPLARDTERTVIPPKAPVWEGMLEDGGVLYIPRGWWHVAMPLDEPTLHLTVGMHNPAGADLLAWYTERLRASAAVRQDLPRFASSSERAEYMAKLRDVFVESWRPELLDEYFAHKDHMAEPRPRLSLPWSATPDLAPCREDTRVEWLPPRPVELKRNGAGIQIACLGKRWKFAETARPLLDHLVHARVCSMRDLQAAGNLNRETLRAFVGELVAAGLVAVRDSESGAPSR